MEKRLGLLLLLLVSVNLVSGQTIGFYRDKDKSLFECHLTTRKFSVDSVGITEKQFIIEYLPNGSTENPGLSIDYMLTIYGPNKTDNFLDSPTLVKSCLEQLVDMVCHSDEKINGINFYFPDYTFKEKRAMAQFIKSASIVIDSCRIDSCRIQSIRDLRLYASFKNKPARNNQNFLNGIAQMTDSIFIFSDTQEERKCPEINSRCFEIDSIIDNSGAQNLNLFSKLENQFYLARYYTKPFPEISLIESNSQYISDLVEADYPDNQWEIFMYAAICIVLLLLAIAVLYLTIPTVSYYMNKNIDYVYSILVMLFLEILLLIGNMFEAMSRDDVFSLNNDNRYIILLLPFLFIFIIPMMKALGKKRNLP